MCKYRKEVSMNENNFNILLGLMLLTMVIACSNDKDENNSSTTEKDIIEIL